jgi:hypothetical protein
MKLVDILGVIVGELDLIFLVVVYTSINDLNERLGGPRNG